MKKPRTVGSLRKASLFKQSFFSELLIRGHRIQVNNLSSSLLALLLLPCMIHTAKEYSTTPRLVIVASDAHFMATVEQYLLEHPKIMETIGSKEYCTKSGIMNDRYPLTKRQYIVTPVCLSVQC
jgi:hypothetical protein